MNKAQLKDRLDCQSADCQYLERCKVYWGCRCARQGGKKVPRIAARSYYGAGSLTDVGTIKKAAVSG